MTVCIYRYIHTTALYYWPNTTGMTHLKKEYSFCSYCIDVRNIGPWWVRVSYGYCGDVSTVQQVKSYFGKWNGLINIISPSVYEAEKRHTFICSLILSWWNVNIRRGRNMEGYIGGLWKWEEEEAGGKTESGKNERVKIEDGRRKYLETGCHLSLSPRDNTQVANWLLGCKTLYGSWFSTCDDITQGR